MENDIKKILILSANPKNTARLRLDEEVREITEGLKRSKGRERFVIQQVWAVRLRDLRRAILDHEPHIVHFCGHGDMEGIMVEDDSGNAVFVKPTALAGLFKLFTNQIECVLLNACYSKLQAETISEHINYVIGMRQAITDKAAIEFAIGFYDAIGANRTICDAFEFGQNAIALHDISEQLRPDLYDRSVRLAGTNNSETHEKGEAFSSPENINLVEIEDMAFTIEDEDVLSINLTIDNKNNERFKVWLGASIVALDWNEYNDTERDKTIILKPGKFQYTRELGIPNNIPKGEYKLVCVVWTGERSNPDRSIKGQAKWSDIFYITNFSEQEECPRIHFFDEDEKIGKAIYMIQECAPSPYGTEGKNRRYINGSMYLIEKKGTSPNNEYYPGDSFRIRDSAIGRRYEAHYYGTGSSFGFPVSEEANAWNSEQNGKVSTGSLQWFEGGNIYFSRGNGAHAIRSGNIWNKFREYEEQSEKGMGKFLTGGKLGFPRTEQYEDESPLGTSATIQHFQYGCIIELDSGTYAVDSKFYDLYDSIGLWKSELGFPKDDEIVFISNQSEIKGSLQHFENGCIIWNDKENKGFFIYGDIYQKWLKEDRNAGFPLNTALVMGDYLMQHFEGGIIKACNDDKSQIYFETGALDQIITIEEAKRLIQKCALSYDIETVGIQGVTKSQFSTKSYKARVVDKKGVIYCHANGKYKGQTFYIRKGIGWVYEDILGGGSSKLGIPVSNEEISTETGCSIAQFEGGYIEWSPKTSIARAVAKTEQGEIILDERKL